MYLLRLAVVFFIFVYPQNVIADAIYEHFDDGVVAFKKGDYKTAENELSEAAETGDYRAMTILGHMYFEGIGMDKDYKKAYKRFSQAAKYNRIIFLPYKTIPRASSTVTWRRGLNITCNM